MQLISNAADALKMTSVQVSLAGSILATLDQVLPSLQAVIPPSVYAVVFVLAAVARIVLQPKLAKYN